MTSSVRAPDPSSSPLYSSSPPPLPATAPALATPRPAGAAATRGRGGERRVQGVVTGKGGTGQAFVTK
eukprot:582878-Rhodomonas_salina.1